MYAIIDLETTGSHKSANRITEIALFIHDGTKVINSFSSLIDPECRIPPFIQNLTGINDEMVKGQPKFFEVAEKVHRMTEGCVFVAHNVSFDYGILRKEFASLGFDYKRRKLCTVRLSRQVFPGRRKYSLGNICADLGITIEARHRAYGDALATVELFEHILRHENGRAIPQALKHRSMEGSLPPALDKKKVEALPNRHGVYYFKDNKGKVIYVGKANNIRSRVMSHFYNKEGKDAKMHGLIADIDYMECGSELMALLVESAEIKRLYPRYNSAQKRRNESWAIFQYTDQKGLIHLAYAQKKQVQNPLIRFYSIGQCRSFMEMLQETFELCPRYTQLQSVSGACFHHRLKKCRGVCCHEESVESYNERARQALSSISGISGSFLIVLEGRKPEECGFVLVENSVYQGYGFYPVPSDEAIDLNQLGKHLVPQMDSSDAQRILRSYFKHVEEPKVLELEETIKREGQTILSMF